MKQNENSNKGRFVLSFSITFLCVLVLLSVISLFYLKNYSNLNYVSGVITILVISFVYGLYVLSIQYLFFKFKYKQWNFNGYLIILGCTILLMLIILYFSIYGVIINFTGF